ncbi:MAG: serine hydrolase domain-containing protein [Woeseiaceae bacterium]
MAPNIPMRGAAVLAAFTLVSAVAFAEEQTSAPEVDALFADYDHPDTPGCALGVIQDGEFIYRQGYGMANLEYDIPITSSSVFRIASTSKQFTAMAIALLAESGEISLQDPLSRFFPEFADWADSVTVTHLLEHSSGVRDYLTLAWLVGLTEYTDHYTLEWVLELLARQRETNFEPGSDFLYSNSGYMLLAQIVERVTGQTLREYSEENIFGPLGMTHSRFQDNHAHIIKNRADGYEPSDTGFDINMTTLNLVGDGAVFTTIDDLLLWDRNFYNNRLGKGDKDLVERAPEYDGDSYYAFGLEWDEYRGLSRISHSGSFAGFRADLMRFPEQQLTVAVLCNRDDAAPTSLANRVAKHYLQGAMQAGDTDGHAADIGKSQYPIAVLAGSYWDSTHMMSMLIEVDGDALWADHPEIGRFELGRIDTLRWQLLDSPWDVTFDFEVANGVTTGVKTEYFKSAWGSFIPFERAGVDAAELSGYSGSYYSPELDIEYQIALSDGQFTFDLKGERPQELSPLFDGMFENFNWGVFEFQEDDSGDVTGFLLHSGRVRNLAFTRSTP